MLYVRIRTKPITRPFRIIRIPFMYVNGSEFKISASIKNVGSQIIQGGQLRILVTYAFGNLFEVILGKAGVIYPQQDVKVDLQGQDKWGVSANGHALFYALFSDNANNQISLCDDKSKPLALQVDSKGHPLGYHVHTFHALTVGELYSLIALTVNSIAFIINIILTTIVNREKLSDIWNILWNCRVPLGLSAFVALVLWLVFVYVLYDRYGL